MIDTLARWDAEATLWINSIHSPASDAVWKVFSNVRIWFVLYALIIVLLIRRLGWKKGLVACGAAILTYLCCDPWFGEMVKYGVARLRPCWTQEMVDGGLRLLEGRGHLYGFFSAHAATTMGFAVCTSTCLRRLDKTHKYTLYGVGMVTWSLLVGFSRVFAGKHYLGDVLVGFAAGLAFGLLLADLAVLLCKKLRTRN